MKYKFLPHGRTSLSRTMHHNNLTSHRIIWLCLTITILFGVTGMYAKAYAATQIESSLSKYESTYNNLTDAVLNSRTNKLYSVDENAYGGPGKGTVFVLNVTAGFKTISEIPENAYPSRLGINEATNMIYVLHSCNCQEGRSISIIEGRSDKVVGTIENVTQEVPTSIYINPLSNKIYVSDGHEISVVDGKTNKIVGRNTLNKTSGGNGSNNYMVSLLAIDTGRNTIYGIDSAKQIVFLNLSNLSLSYTNVTIASTPDPRATDNRVLRMIVGPTSDILYIINEAVFPLSGSNEGVPIPVAYLMAVDAASGKVISDNVAELRGFHFDLQINAEKNVVYAMNGDGFSVIDGGTNSLKEEYVYDTSSLSSFDPRIMLRNPSGDAIYFVGPNAIIVVPEASIIPEFQLPILPTIVALAGVVGYFSFNKSRRH